MDQGFQNLGTPVVVVPGFPFPTRFRVSAPGFTVGTGVTTLLQNDPGRLFWYAENIGGFQARMSPTRDVSTIYGRLIDSNGGNVSMSLAEDGSVTGWEIYAIANGGASAFYVLEVLRADQPSER